MAKILLAILCVLGSVYALPNGVRLRDFSWLKIWLSRVFSGAREGLLRAPLTALMLPIFIFLLCWVIQSFLQGMFFGLPAFAFAVIVLFFCWGPRDLEADIATVIKAPDSERRIAAAQALRPDPAEQPLPWQSTALVEASFLSALARWFGVLFWFVVLGPAGALSYRVIQLMARASGFSTELSADQQSVLTRAALVLDWAPAHLMALTLALVSDFDAVISTWRGYHATHGKGYFTLDLGFLTTLAHAGIDADVLAGDDYTTDVMDPLVELTEARTVLRRMLLTWLAIIALLALAGWVG